MDVMSLEGETPPKRWFWGEVARADVDLSVVVRVRASDKEQAGGLMMDHLFNSVRVTFLGFQEDQPDDYFEPQVREMTDSEQETTARVRQGLESDVALFMIHEPPAPDYESFVPFRAAPPIEDPHRLRK